MIFSTEDALFVIDTGSTPRYVGPFFSVAEATKVAKAMRLKYPRIDRLSQVNYGMFARTATGSMLHLAKGQNANARFTECGRRVATMVEKVNPSDSSICHRCTATRQPVYN